MVTCADCVLFMTVTGERRRQFVTLKICTHSEGPPPAKCCAHPPSATTTHLNTGVSCGVSQSVISRRGASTDWVWGLCDIFSSFLCLSLLSSFTAGVVGWCFLVGSSVSGASLSWALLSALSLVTHLLMIFKGWGPPPACCCRYSS